MMCTRPDIYHAVGGVSRFLSNPGKEHWAAVTISSWEEDEEPSSKQENHHRIPMKKEGAWRHILHLIVERRSALQAS